MLTILRRLRHGLTKDNSKAIAAKSTARKSQYSTAKAKQAEDNEVLTVGDGNGDEDTIEIFDDEDTIEILDDEDTVEILDDQLKANAKP